MTTPAVSVNVESRALADAISAFQAFAKLTPAEVVAKKGADLRTALYRRFFAIQPRPGKIPADVKARGYRVGRRALGGFVSPSARLAAAKMMGGQRVVYGRVDGGAGVAGILRTVRIGRRGTRITGGRSGRGGRAATPAESSQFRLAGEKRLTRRNLEVHFETTYRERGRGYLGSSFLLLRRRKGPASERRAGIPYRLVANKAKGVAPYRIEEGLTIMPNLSRFQIETDQAGISERDAVIASAYADVRADTLVYVERKLAEAARKAGLQ